MLADSRLVSLIMSGPDHGRRRHRWRTVLILLLIQLLENSHGQKKRKPISTALQAKWSQTPFVLEVRKHEIQVIIINICSNAGCGVSKHRES